jgi:NarL family two-component system response regulator LiaR
MKVILYDDHIFVTEAIASYIHSFDKNADINQCQTIAAVKACLAGDVPDIFISDVLSDENAGLSLFHFIAQFYPTVKIVAYTSISNSFIIQSLLNIGVSRVVSKKEKIAALWDSALGVYEDQKNYVFSEQPAMILSSREREIAIFLAQGLTAKEIAVNLGTSSHTTNNQKNALLAKFDCTNSTELVVKLAQMGLINVL